MHIKPLDTALKLLSGEEVHLFTLTGDLRISRLTVSSTVYTIIKSLPVQ